ncbi:MAG: anti-sigma factor antagonist [Lachnospiraceae bacterium]|nr:anti-sigma factor antagonist [Lachnospiraceae bacterium]
MIFQYELKDNGLRIMVPKELDHHSSLDLREQTDMLLRTYSVKNLIFDFQNTEFMDSSGIGMMIGRCKNMEFTGGKVQAEHMNKRIQKIFLLSGLHKMIKIEEGGEEE